MHLAATLTICRWPRSAPQPHVPQGEYAERFWLPVVGPSGLWLLRWAQRELVACEARSEADDSGAGDSGGGFDIDSNELAQRIGLGVGTARQSPLRRSLKRLETFELARRLDESVVEFRTTLPPVSTRQLERMPVNLRREHRVWDPAPRLSSFPRPGSA